jgi:hypothetical protein
MILDCNCTMCFELSLCKIFCYVLCYVVKLSHTCDAHLILCFVLVFVTWILAFIFIVYVLWHVFSSLLCDSWAKLASYRQATIDDTFYHFFFLQALLDRWVVGVFVISSLEKLTNFKWTITNCIFCYFLFL